MMRIPKEMEGRKADILVEGIATLEVKIIKITDDEITAEHDDGEPVHISHDALRVWWETKRKEISQESIAKRKATIARKKLSSGQKP